jgi:tetraacyldisaccharide-1-P 4'-kinase
VGELDGAAAAVGADVLLTTEKDWAKLEGMARAASTKVPILRVEMAIRFREGDEQALLVQILKAPGVGT